MTEGQKHYLQEVLGIRQVMVPEGESLQVLQIPKLRIYCGERPSEAGQTLVAKMMTAAKVSEFEYQDEGDISGPSLIFGEKALAQTGIELNFENCLGQIVEISGYSVMVSHSLTDMLEGSEDQVKTYKMQTWSHLKKWMSQG